MAHKITPFLMFEGSAEEAMRFYVSLFSRSEIKRVELYGAGEPGTEGSVKRADFTVAGQEIICIDSPVMHKFSFTPSISFLLSARMKLSSMQRSASSQQEGRCLCRRTTTGSAESSDG